MVPNAEVLEYIRLQLAHGKPFPTGAQIGQAFGVSEFSGTWRLITLAAEGHLKMKRTPWGRYWRHDFSLAKRVAERRKPRRKL